MGSFIVYVPEQVASQHAHNTPLERFLSSSRLLSKTCWLQIDIRGYYQKEKASNQ